MEKVQISKYFEEDHDRLDNLFRKFQEMKRIDYPRAKESFRDFKFGLQRHIIWEEEILFPIFEKKTGMTESGPTFVMRMEHRKIGAALEALHEKVRAADPNSDAEETQLLLALGPHNQKEEGILYPAIDDIVNGADVNSIFEAMDKMPEERYASCCGHHVHEHSKSGKILA